MSGSWRVVVHGRPVYDLIFEGRSWDEANRLRDEIDENGVRATIERDDDGPDVLDFAESVSIELKQNRPIAVGRIAR